MRYCNKERFVDGIAFLSRISVLLIGCLLLAVSAAPAETGFSRPVLVQVLLGAAQYGEDSLTFIPRAPGEESRENLSTTPVFGVLGQYPLVAGRSQFGVEWGGLLSWRSRNTSIYSTIYSTQVRIETSFRLFDFFIGPYISQSLGKHWRIYASAGPSLLFASYREDRAATPDPLSVNDSDADSEQFGVGGFVRVGADYQISPGGYVGICARGLASNLDFEQAATGGPLSGIQGFLTFSREF